MLSSPYDLLRSIAELTSKHHETPFFVMDLTTLEHRLKCVLEECSKVGAFYSYPVKANSSTEVLRCMLRHGVDFDVCSLEELETLLSCGCSPGRIRMCGAGFSKDEIKGILDRRIALDLDSLDELAAVTSIDPVSAVGIRVAIPGRFGSDDELPYARKFGISIDDLPQIKEMIGSSQVRIDGFHIHGIFPAEDMEEALHETLRTFAELSPRVVRINFGGGWGDGLSEDWLRRARRHIQTCAAIGKTLGAERIIFEPGEALAGPAGWLVTRIRALKPGRAGRNHGLVAICDTPYTFAIGSGLVRSIYPVEVLDVGHLLKEGAPVFCSLYGRNNTPYDLIRAAVELPSPSVGMILAIGGQGAYVVSVMGRFNSRTVPDVIFVGN